MKFVPGLAQLKQTTIFMTNIILFCLLICYSAAAGQTNFANNDTLFVSSVFTEKNGFTSGVEGPAVDKDGNLYAVNFQKQSTIGKVTQEGICSLFVELPSGSVGNGIRFNSQGKMLIADYKAHNILSVDMDTREIEVYVHYSQMNQPNDIAIGDNDIVYAGDPKWSNNTGNIWRIDTDKTVHLLESNMGTTNGIGVAPGSEILYVNESGRNVWAYDLSPVGEISNKRLLIQFSDYAMDGMRCDSLGNLYITRYHKGTVVVVSPEGQLLREISLIGKTVSNIAFGGPDGRTCYVTMVDNQNIETFRTDIPGRSWVMMQSVSNVKKKDNSSRAPFQFKLSQNYPNPFNPRTVIKYEISEGANVSLKIYDMLGREIVTLLNGYHKAGGYEVLWDASSQPSGIYFYHLQVGKKCQTNKMMFLR